MTSNTYPQFSDPYTARLLTLRNRLLAEPVTVYRDTSAIVRLPAPARPTFEEMMAIVNRPRKRLG
jgi:hypothetical protein